MPRALTTIHKHAIISFTARIAIRRRPTDRIVMRKQLNNLVQTLLPVRLTAEGAAYVENIMYPTGCSRMEVIDLCINTVILMHQAESTKAGVCVIVHPDGRIEVLDVPRVHSATRRTSDVINRCVMLVSYMHNVTFAGGTPYTFHTDGSEVEIPLPLHG